MFIDTDVMDDETAERIQNLGAITIEKETYEALVELGVTFHQLVVSHVRGDYGEVPPQQAWDNDLAMYNQSGQCRSVYKMKDGRCIVVLTQWNQPITSIHLEEPNENLSDMQTGD